MKVLIIGSGISGLSCAITAAEKGYEVTMVSPYSSERAQSVLAAGGINGVMGSDPEDNFSLHAEDTFKSGCFIENKADLETLCRKAPEHIKWLESLGTQFTRNKDLTLSTRALGGHSRKRTQYAGTATGKLIVTALTRHCLELEIEGKVIRKTGYHFHSALIKDGICYGALMLKDVTGQLEEMKADALIMATGGQNKIFGKTTGSELCDGYATGKLFMQGALLRDLEFIQFHPTSIETDNKRILISEGARGEGGRLFYMDGDKRVYFMEDKYGEKGNLMPRDIVAREIYTAPSQVYLDVSFLDKRVIFGTLTETFILCRDYLGIDITREPIPVRPTMHFYMGGLKVDSYHRTNIENLYAIGECASKYHGANRLGGNSLLAAVHSGRRVVEGLKTEVSTVSMDFATYKESAQKEIDRLFAGTEGESCTALQHRLNKIAGRGMRIIRTGETLERGLTEINEALDKLNTNPPKAGATAYENYRIEAMMVLAKAAIISAIGRKESRGAHKRLDYPDTLPEYAKSSEISYDGGTYTLKFVDENPKEVQA